jgi:hypothetical protein
VPLPSSGSGRPVKAVTLEFSADHFRGNLREKDLKAIGLDVVDQAHAAGKLLFRGFVVLGVLNCGQAFFKSANVSRIIGEDVIRKANPAGKILREEFRDFSSEKPKSAKPSRSALRMSWFARFIRPCLFLRRSILSTSFSAASGSLLKMTTLDSAAAARRRQHSGLS